MFGRWNSMRSENLLIDVALALGVLLSTHNAVAQVSNITRSVHVASHRLGFSNVVVSVKEDYRQTKWPVAHRTFFLRGPNGRLVYFPIRDGGAGDLDALSLYRRVHSEFDSHGHAIGGDYLLLGAQECVGFDPVFLEIKRCVMRPPCKGKLREDLIYIGRFDWANGYDPPRGQFQFGWRFLPFEEGSEESFCPESSDTPDHP